MSNEVRIPAPPITRQSALENAARVIRFSESETNPMFADHLLDVAAKWMELAETIGE